LTNRSNLALRRDLGVWGAVAIVIGTVIGSGIFLVPKRAILKVGDPWELFFVWVFGGLLSLAGALTYADLYGGIGARDFLRGRRITVDG